MPNVLIRVLALLLTETNFALSKNDDAQEALHANYDHICAININDVADNFTAGGLKQVRKKPKISAEKNKLFLRYRS